MNEINESVSEALATYLRKEYTFNDLYDDAVNRLRAKIKRKPTKKEKEILEDKILSIFHKFRFQDFLEILENENN